MLRKRDRTSAETHVRRLLEIFRIDCESNEFRETPRRIVAAWEEMLAGAFTTKNKLPFNFTTFESSNDQLLVEGPIAFASLCPHHFLPYLGEARVGYIPNGKVVGISKISRLVRHCASFALKQEDLTATIASEMENRLQASAVIVSIKAIHTCKRIRGVKDCSAQTTTTALRGKDALAVKNEFYQMINLPEIR